MPAYPQSQGDSTDEASEAAILDGVEGWLRQRVSDGKINLVVK
jgi:hypothetical protein